MSLDIGVFGARGVPSTYGGYETFLTTLLPELAARGHRVTAYCRAEAVDGDAPWRGVIRTIVPGVDSKQLSTLTHGASAARMARKAGHDVVLVVNPANALFCLWNRWGGQKVVLNTDGQEWLRGKWGRAARAWFRTAARVARHCATGLIADGGAMADIYQRDYGAGSTVIPYCAPPGAHTLDDTVLAQLRLQADSYFVIAARLNPENNVDTVAEAYHRSDLEQPLVVLGAANYDSPVRRRLEALSAEDERIRFVGHVDDRASFLTLLSAARAYIHGHSVGGTNPSLIEAMGVGAVVVALDTPFNRETLGDAGLYFPGGMAHVGDVAGVLRSLAERPTSAVRMRERATSRIAETFGVGDVVDAYEAVLLASVGHPGTGLVVPTKWSTRDLNRELAAAATSGGRKWR